MIDPRTVLFLASMLGGLMAVVLFVLRRTHPARIDGLGTWSLGLLGIAVGTMLAFCRPWLPEMLTVSVARVLLLGSLFAIYLGTLRFIGLKPNLRVWVPVILMGVMLQVVFTHVHPSFHARLIVATSLAASLFLSQAWVLWAHATPTFAPRLCLAVSLLLAMLQLMRLVTSFVLPLGESVYVTTTPNMVYVVGLALAVLFYSVGMVLMASERLRTELEQLATRDSLTNAINRRQMTALFENELERCHRQDRSMGLLLLDLDHFKTINDTYGHQAGDEVLIKLVANTKLLLRQSDQVARFGGEEFAVLLPDTSLEKAIAAAERIRASCAAPGKGLSCTVSIGVTTNQNDADTLDSMLARADKAMYRAKANGRNRVETG
ncbi:GGDEF domain-containing protein [Rhodoferax sp. PAMC 29310]|uniref:GGDEF domain-containing protein n=1 Tax=Rhodoferax sp. PAMC 29310 TaxID=2822760 RepID=UPI001B337CCA|nr:GGDEF domain-containing protein [Rhodoferax sp. PAMC 29310]